jgi:PAS domain S-box-containing protein
LGYTEKELLESQFLSFIHPDDVDLTLKEIEKLQSGALTVNFENRYLKKDGNYLWFDWNTTPNPDTGKLYAVARDITKQKKAKELLTESEEHNRFIMNSSLNSIVTINSSKKITFWNQQAEAIFGWKKEEVLGKKMIDLIIPLRHRAKWVKIINDYNKTGESTYLHKLLEFKLIHKAGNEFFGEASIVPIFQKGEIYFCGFLHDISKRKQVENQLIHIENRNKLIMNASLNAIITIDIKGIITFWNQKAEIIFGWNSEEVLGKELSKVIIPHQYVDAYHGGMKHYLRTGEGPFLNKPLDMTALNRKGVEFPVEMSIFPVNENNQVFFCAFIQDISEKKIGENIRKIQEEKFQNVITHMNLGLVEVDNKEIIQYVNQSFASISGYEISELVGKNIIDFFDFQDNLDIIESKKKLRQQGVSDIYQIPIKKKSGEQRWLTISGAPNYDGKGNVIGSIGIHLDITDQKKMESDLEKEKINALKSSKAKEVFLANMSHEIRTPLNAIIGFLRELDKLELAGLQKDYVNNSSIASKHLLAIINNILDISKIESGEMNLESVDFVFEKSISNVTTVLHPMLKQKGLDFKVTISKEIGKVLVGDAMRLQQILYNLVGNAIKFTSTGSISINCELVDDRIFSQKLKISILDTGIGMESSFVSTIFNKFSQEDIETNLQYGGTGLGLSITKELVELMGGTIEIESEKNRGTSICLYLNYPKSSKENAVDLNIIQPVIRLKNISILLVEDNYLNRMVAQNSLQYYNCEVTEAENGLEAVEILKNKTFDIILMDIQMPIMGGIEAVLIIRNELNITTPIIALTANAFKTEIDQCKKAGMNDYVAKPFDEDILIETIAKYTMNKITSVAEPEFPETASIEKLYNLTTLQNLSRNNNEFVLKMVGIFVEQTIATIEKIDAALESNNFLEISRLIHKIRSSTDNMGILSIRSEMKTLEKIAKETQNKGQITAIYKLVKETLQLVISQLQKDELNA